MSKAGPLLCLIFALVPACGLRADPLFEASGQNKGEFTVIGEQASLASRFTLKFVKPGWKGNYDSIINIADPQIRPDGLQYSATIGSLGGYRVVLTKTSPTALRCDYDIVVFGRVPVGAAFISVIIPAAFAQQRGAFSSAPTAWTPFPLNIQKQLMFAGQAHTFSWNDGLGRNIRLVFPDKTRLNLSDMRQWGRPLFELRIFLPLSRTPGSVSFPLTIETFTEGTPTRTFVDRFGQCTTSVWPGKITCEKDLQDDIRREDDFLKSHQPPERDEFGGWTGSREKFNLHATGFFRTQKINGHWWLVDPKGNAFFSLGTFLVYLDTYTDPTGREELFEWLPPKNGIWERIWMTLQGSQCVSFYRANLVAKYGKDWGRDWYENSVQRWNSWGFNTTSAFGGRLRGIPYANGPYQFIDQCATPLPGTSPDIFDPNLPIKLDALCKTRLGKLKDDPLFVGYFFGNEQSFEKVPAVVPGLSQKYAAKRKLVELLSLRYKTIGRFNQAWNVKAKDFSSLASMKLSAATPKAREDMDAFFALYCDTYGRLLRDTVKKYDPNHLLLGFRWTPITARNRIVAERLGRYMDVISINYYTKSGIDTSFVTTASKLAGDKPVLLSEWSYGSRERGHTGGVINVADQKERGLNYRAYVETAAAIPCVVGCHWYEYVDQAVTGRYFGGDKAERCNSGLVDIADRPYADFLEHVMKTNYHIYDVASGKTKPTPFPLKSQTP